MKTLSVINGTKYLGGRALFENLAFSVKEGEKVGIIGRNGCGKSTVLSIIAGALEFDEGKIAQSPDLHCSLLPQRTEFAKDPRSVEEIILSVCPPEFTHIGLAALSRCGFTDTTVKANSLSGGWHKRLALAVLLAKQPDMLLLDEPTNHLDLYGLLWLEQFLKKFRGGFIVITHDRYILSSICDRIIEINSLFDNYCLDVSGNYQTFKQIRADTIANMHSEHVRLKSILRREEAWLKQGAKARTTKAKARIDFAIETKEKVKALGQRITSDVSAELGFQKIESRSKELLTCKHISVSVGDKSLLSEFTLTLTPKSKVAIVGPNGSGKTSLLKVLAGLEKPSAGKINTSQTASVAYFDQYKTFEDPTILLKEALVDEGDYVFIGERKVHVVSWAEKFLFSPDQFMSPVGELSGGEQARVHLAQTMARNPAILFLDEPTNDLDIWSCEALEQALIDFEGAVVIVSHDRSLLDSVCDNFVFLDGKGSSIQFSSYDQISKHIQNSTKSDQKSPPKKKKPQKEKKKGLSYKENKELESIESEVDALEEKIQTLEAKLQDSATAKDAALLHEISEDLHQAQTNLNLKIERWSALEEKKAHE